MKTKSYLEDGLKSMALYNIAFTVNNIDQSVKWYTEILGFKLTTKSTFSIPSGSAEVAILELGDLKLELLQVPNNKKIPEMFADAPLHLIPIGNKAIVFQVTDLKLTTKELEKKEVKFVWKEQYLAGDKMLCTMIEDTDGNKINIFQSNTTFATEDAIAIVNSENTAAKHLELWSEQNSSIRRHKMEALYLNNVRFIDPFTNLTGKEKLNEFIMELQKKYSGFLFSLVGDVLYHNNTIKFNWEYSSHKDSEKITGTDVLILRNERVDKIMVFIDNLPSQN